MMYNNNAHAQFCYTVLGANTARWKFTPLYVRNNSSAGSTPFSSAMTGWNTLNQPFWLVPYGSGGSTQTDILISDAVGNPNYVGQETPSSSGSCNGWDGCSNCYNVSSVKISSSILLNMTEIARLATSYAKSQSAVETTAITHELGHSMALGHASAHSACDSDLSIMNPTIDQLVICDLTAPLQCGDASSLSNLYYGTGGPNSYCAGGCSGTCP